MALLKLGAIATDIRGSVGGVTFTRSRTGAVARARVTPTASASPIASFERARHSVAVNHWRTVLTDAQRIVWNDAATTLRIPNKLGDLFSPSGFMLFMRSVGQLGPFGVPLPTVPPDPLVSPPFPFEVVWTGIPNPWFLQSLPNSSPAHSGLFLYWYAIDRPASQYYPRGPWTLAGFFGYTATIAVGTSLSAPNPRFRPSRRAFRFRFFNTAAGPSSIIIRDVFIPPAP